MIRHQPYRPPISQIPADPLRGNPCDTRDPQRCVQPLKGLGEPRAASVSYRAYPLLGKDKTVLSRPCPARDPPRLPHRHSATPPAIPGHGRPRPCGGTSNRTSNMLPITIHHSSFIILHCLTPSPPKSATPKPAYLTLAHGITAPI